MSRPENIIAPKTGTEAAQTIFGRNLVFGPQSKHLWQAQDQILDEVQKFSTAWFKRRHEATRSTLGIVSSITTGEFSQPAIAMKAMTDWQTHILERLAEDAKDCSELMTRCAESLVSHEIEAVEEIADTAKKVTSGRHALPV